MSYPDPYAEQYRDSYYQNQQHYGSGETGSDFNPYLSRQPHPTYDQGDAVAGGYEPYDTGYRDDSLSDPYRKVAARIQPSHDNSKQEESAVPTDDVVVTAVPVPFGGTKDKSAHAIRNYRLDHQGNLWTRGSRGRCIGRFFCCTSLIGVFLLLSILLSLALWIRPPNIEIKDVGPASSTGSTVQFQLDGVQINLGVNISVQNPNYFDVNFQRITAEIFYPIDDTPIGGGTSRNVVFKSNALTNWTFPFTVDYKLAKDPGGLIIIDLARKCGLVGPKSDLTVKYKITLGIRILFITINPLVSNSFRFECPLDPNELQGLMQTAGIDLATLAGGLGIGS